MKPYNGIQGFLLFSLVFLCTLGIYHCETANRSTPGLNTSCYLCLHVFAPDVPSFLPCALHFHPHLRSSFPFVLNTLKFPSLN